MRKRNTKQSNLKDKIVTLYIKKQVKVVEEFPNDLVVIPLWTDENEVSVGETHQIAIPKKSIAKVVVGKL
jgi:hypothetical protein